MKNTAEMMPAEYCYTVHVKVTHMSVLLYKNIIASDNCRWSIPVS